MPTQADFELAETPVPTPGAGQVLVRNIFMSVDPYMRGRMVDRASYVPPFQIGEALSGGAVGQVVASNERQVQGRRLRQQLLRLAGMVRHRRRRAAEARSGAGAAPAYLGTFGMPGLTAYAGLLKVAELKEGERVFVSAAAGAVGSIVCQIAKNKGCYVVGSAGSDEKCAWLVKEAGVDQAINYKTGGRSRPRPCARRPARHRRLFRQCRRRPSECGAGQHALSRTHARSAA